jgi:hypothetical protein
MAHDSKSLRPTRKELLETFFSNIWILLVENYHHWIISYAKLGSMIWKVVHTDSVERCSKDHVIKQIKNEKV